MRSMKNAVLSFGMVTVPVGVGSTATSDEESQFKTLHVDCSTPIKMPRHCPVCDVNVEAGETVRGFEFTKGQYVFITDEEYDEVRPDRSKVIRINKFVRSGGIPEEWVNKRYWLIPDKILGDAYAMLVGAMLLTDKVGLGFSTLWEKEHVCVVAPIDGKLMFSTLHSAKRINTPDFDVPDSGERELAAAVQMVEAWSGDVESEDMSPASNTALADLISSKVLKTEYGGATAVEVPEPSVDLLTALRESIAARPKVTA